MAESVEQIVRRLEAAGNAACLPRDRDDGPFLDAMRDFYGCDLPEELNSLYKTGAKRVFYFPIYHPAQTFSTITSFSEEYGQSFVSLIAGDESGRYIINLKDRGPLCPLYYFGTGYDESPPRLETASIADFLLKIERDE